MKKSNIKSYYSEKGFWDKLKKYAKVIGKNIVEKALWLYYAMEKPNCPSWAKTVIIGALAYLIFPVDAVPDIIPGVGYTDDMGLMMAAIGTVSFLIDKDVKKKANEKLSDWFD